MQPQWLCLETFCVQVRWPLRLFFRRPDVAANTFNKMAAAAIFLSNQLATFRNGLWRLIPHFQRDRILHHADKHTGYPFHILLSETEVRHLQQFFRSLNTADVEDPWIFQLLFVPRASRMFDRKEPEIELRNQLA